MKRAVIECVRCKARIHIAMFEPIQAKYLHSSPEPEPPMPLEEIPIDNLLRLNCELRAQVEYLQKCLLNLSKKKKRQT